MNRTAGIIELSRETGIHWATNWNPLAGKFAFFWFGELAIDTEKSWIWSHSVSTLRNVSMRCWRTLLSMIVIVATAWNQVVFFRDEMHGCKDAIQSVCIPARLQSWFVFLCSAYIRVYIMRLQTRGAWFNQTFLLANLFCPRKRRPNTYLPEFRSFPNIC